jgi:hypothetical protein
MLIWLVWRAILIARRGVGQIGRFRSAAPEREWTTKRDVLQDTVLAGVLGTV